MTTITINTRDHGAIEFSIQKEGGYVRANTDREKWIETAMNYWDHEMPRVSLEHIYDAGLAKLPD